MPYNIELASPTRLTTVFAMLVRLFYPVTSTGEFDAQRFEAASGGAVPGTTSPPTPAPTSGTGTVVRPTDRLGLAGTFGGQAPVGSGTSAPAISPPPSLFPRILSPPSPRRLPAAAVSPPFPSRRLPAVAFPADVASAAALLCRASSVSRVPRRDVGDNGQSFGFAVLSRHVQRVP